MRVGDNEKVIYVLQDAVTCVAYHPNAHYMAVGTAIGRFYMVNNEKCSVVLSALFLPT